MKDDLDRHDDVKRTIKALRYSRRQTMKKACICLMFLAFLLAPSCTGDDGGADGGDPKKGGPCEIDDDCDLNWRCINGFCYSMICSSENDCRSGEYCHKPLDSDTGLCRDLNGEDTCTKQDDCEGDERCVDGKCRPKTCSTGADCLPGEICAFAAGSTTGVCEPDPDITDGDGDGICLEGDFKCRGNERQICRSGSGGELDWYYSEDCILGCSEGQCLVQVCIGGDERCNYNAVEECDSQGMGWTVTRDCSDTSLQCKEEIEGDAIDAYCGAPELCNPGARVCDYDRNYIMECNDDGTDFFVQRQCGNLYTCVQNGNDVECISTAICTPRRFRCNNNNVEQCSSDGMSWRTVQQCPPDSPCACGSWVNDECTQAVCQRPDICEVGATRCNEDNTMVEKCLTGGGWTPDFLFGDCAGSGQTCVDGQCI